MSLLQVTTAGPTFLPSGDTAFITGFHQIPPVFTPNGVLLYQSSVRHLSFICPLSEVSWFSFVMQYLSLHVEVSLVVPESISCLFILLSHVLTRLHMLPSVAPHKHCPASELSQRSKPDDGLEVLTCKPFRPTSSWATWPMTSCMLRTFL